MEHAECIFVFVLFADAFFVSKTENRNQVQYAVVVDAQCAPGGAAPAFARWKMLEKGAAVEEGLLDRNRVRIVLRALPSRPIVIDTFVRDGACQAVARMTIAGANMRLFNVHVALRWPIGVDHLLVQGWSDDGRIVRERIAP